MNWVIKVDPPRFLVIRHLYQDPGFYDIVLQWIEFNHPEYLPLFKVHDLPGPVPDYSNYVLHIPWLQDPVQNWSESAYEAACQIGNALAERGIPIVNRVDRLLNAAKSNGARLIAQAGFRTPKMARIEDPQAFRETLLGIPLPLFIREDWGHGGPMIRCDTLAEARTADFSELKRPVAVELIDLPDPHDGLYRKYRYIAAGDVGVSHHLVHTKEWITHADNRYLVDSTRDEELAYLDGPDPFHDAFQRARRNLELEWVAFDYSLDRQGNPVIWEANPYPVVKIAQEGTVYRNHARHRTILAMLTLYLRMGGQPVPPRFDEILSYAQSVKA